jgi:hypothetical protein
MAAKDKKIEIIKPPTRIKFKKFCKNVYNKYRNRYISYNDDKPTIDIRFLIELLVSKLKPDIDVSYCRHKKYEENNFIDGILDIISNCSYWNRYRGLISGKYLNKRRSGTLSY